LGSCTRAEAIQFIADFRNAARKGIFYWDRRETMATLLELGYRSRQGDDIIRSLCAENYAYGPEPDNKGGPWDVWVFGVKIGKEIYIKLSLVPYRDEVKAVCNSFHFAAHPLNHPFAV
jgi:hypothetical protein